MTLTEFLLARIAEDEGDARSLGGALRGTAWQDGAGTPDRVLAECGAKRRIVEHCEPDPLTKSPGDKYVLCLLALPYAGHPDYRPEWRP